jgi:hypothetical protein
MIELRVIDGGRSLAPGEADRVATAAAGCDIDLLRRVRRAEKNARIVVELLAPAFAVVSNTDEELAAMVASADIDDGIATASIFAKAAAITRALAATLQAASDGLSAAAADQAKPPIR